MCDAYLLCKMNTRICYALSCFLSFLPKRMRYGADMSTTLCCRCKWDNIQDPTINGGHLNAHIEYINYIKVLEECVSFVVELCVCLGSAKRTPSSQPNRVLKSNVIKIVHNIPYLCFSLFA